MKHQAVSKQSLIFPKKASPERKELSGRDLFKETGTAQVSSSSIADFLHMLPSAYRIFNVIKCHFLKQGDWLSTLKRCSVMQIEIFRKRASSKALINQRLPFPKISNTHTHTYMHPGLWLTNNVLQFCYEFQNKQLPVY